MAHPTPDQDPPDAAQEPSAANAATEEDRPQGKNKPRCAEENIIRLRKAMQQERREALAELRPPGLRDRPWTATDSYHNQSFRSANSSQSNPVLDIGRWAPLGTTKMEAASETVSPKKGDPSTMRQKTLRSTEALLAKVERAHKPLIRKEVWRQKFEFLYKEVEEETRLDRKNRSNSTGAITGGSSSGNALGSSAEGSEAALGSSSRPSSRPSSASYARLGTKRRSSSAASAATVGLAALPVGELANIPAEGQEAEHPQDKPLALVEAAPSRPASVPVACGGWCYSGKELRRYPKWRPSATRSGSKPSILPPQPLHRLLTGSSSLPSLIADRRSRELVGIRDEYYGGDDKFLNEDILFCSNPELFPLRVSHNKAFPLEALPVA